jgi:hypothetical protein
VLADLCLYEYELLDLRGVSAPVAGTADGDVTRTPRSISGSRASSDTCATVERIFM